ncbi:MAG: SiaC family regulatory phosphoprotein [Prolixibacteraceae bacterium]|nr:SiaC family regulatory phosphoprotein [Prolixibacteraceae bacterium]
MKKIVIHWYYEDGDDDILERGKYISESLNIPLEFIEIDDISDC